METRSTARSEPVAAEKQQVYRPRRLNLMELSGFLEQRAPLRSQRSETLWH